MKYLVSMDYHKRMPVIPSRIGAEQFWVQRNTVPAHSQYVIDMVKYARPIPFTREDALWTDQLNNIAVGPILVTGEKPVKETLQETVPKINKMLEEIRERNRK